MKDAQLPYPVITAHQVHGFNVAVIDRPGITRDELQGYDALVTNIPECAIGVRTADCIPILLYDPVNKAVAAIHSGWKGTVQKIIHKTLGTMFNEYGTKTDDLIAAIGPGICKSHFQVGNEVVQFFKEAGFPLEKIWSFDGSWTFGDPTGGHHIDLAEANKWLLTESGLKEENIILSGICSFHDDRFYSARREGFDTGRTINAISIR